MKWKTIRKFNNYKEADDFRKLLLEENENVKVRKYGGKQETPIRFEVKVGGN